MIFALAGGYFGYNKYFFKPNQNKRAHLANNINIKDYDMTASGQDSVNDSVTSNLSDGKKIISATDFYVKNNQAWNKTTVNELGISFDYPKDWLVDYLLTPENTINIYEKTGENSTVAISLLDNKDNLTIEDYFNNNLPNSIFVNATGGYEKIDTNRYKGYRFHNINGIGGITKSILVANAKLVVVDDINEDQQSNGYFDRIVDSIVLFEPVITPAP